MKKIGSKKLALTREILRRLSDAELGEAHGVGNGPGTLTTLTRGTILCTATNCWTPCYPCNSIEHCPSKEGCPPPKTGSMACTGPATGGTGGVHM